MKRIPLLLIPFILMASSCVVAFPFNGIAGNGNVVTISMPVTGFSAVKNMTSARVRVAKGASASAKVSIDENLLESLDIRVENNVLLIAVRSGTSIYHYREFTVDVALPSLTSVVANSSGNITVAGTFVGRSLELSILGSGDISGSFSYDTLNASIQGSGNIAISCDARDFTAKIEGSGDIRAVGDSERFHGIIGGSGDIEADGFTAGDAVVRINGSGSCTLRADDFLDVGIYGSGSVYYYGTPAISQIDSGSGSLKQLSF